MRLTIIIPTIGNSTLQRAIDSIAQQTISTSVVMETDNSRRGAGPTRNLAIKRTISPWIGFCDDDDWLDPQYHEWLEKESPGYDMVIFRMQNAPIKEEAIPQSQKLEDLEFNKVGISFAVKTEVAKKIPFKNKIGEDWDFIQDVLKAGYKVKISDKIAYYIGDLMP